MASIKKYRKGIFLVKKRIKNKPYFAIYMATLVKECKRELPTQVEISTAFAKRDSRSNCIKVTKLVEALFHSINSCKATKTLTLKFSFSLL